MNESKPTICIDLDEVVWDWLRPFVAFMRARATHYGVNPDKCPNDLRKWTNWDGFTNYGYNREQFIAAYKDFCAEGFFSRLPAIKGARKVLNEIGARADIVFVTMRPPDILLDTAECFRLNGITNWSSLIHVASNLPGKLGSNKTTLWHNNGFPSKPAPHIQSKADVFRLCRPTVVIDDKPEYIEQAVDAGVPNAIIVARLHNVKWRRENLLWSNAIRGAPGLTFKFRNCNVGFVYPDWRYIKSWLELTKYGKETDCWDKWEKGLGQGYSVPDTTKEVGAR